LSDYLYHSLPYIIPERIEARDFADFWIEEIEPGNVRRGLASSAVIRAQLDVQLTSGNPADARHAGYLSDCDVFVSEDGAFYYGLRLAVEVTPESGVPVFLERGQPDVVGQLEAALDAPSAGDG
jgi:hypothetical protein